MTIGSLVTNVHNELSDEEVEGSSNNFGMAEFEAEVFNYKYTFLADSGSELTAIDDKVFEKIKNQTTETVSYTHLDVYKRQILLPKLCPVRLYVYKMVLEN